MKVPRSAFRVPRSAFRVPRSSDPEFAMQETCGGFELCVLMLCAALLTLACAVADAWGWLRSCVK